MNEKIRGSIKSKMMMGNGGLIAGLVGFWNDPALAFLPDKAKYIILGILAANMILRYLTNSSLAEKGKTEPEKILERSPDFRASVQLMVIKEVKRVLAEEKRIDPPATTEDAFQTREVS